MEIAPGIYLLKVPIPDNPLENLNCYVVEGKEYWIDECEFNNNSQDRLDAAISLAIANYQVGKQQ